MRKVRLVLGGGAAKGLAHLGVLEELLREGVEIEAVAGCSMGAIVGAFFCQRGETSDAMALINDLGEKSLLRFMDPVFFKSGLADQDKFRAFLVDRLGCHDFSQLRIPFRCNAVDLVSGSEQVFSRGDLAEALLASSAVPGLFPPVKRGKKYLIDGGVLNALPVSILCEPSRALTLAVKVFSCGRVAPGGSGRLDQEFLGRLEKSLIFDEEKAGRKRGPAPAQTIFTSFLVMMKRLQQLNLELRPPDFLVDVETEHFSFFDFSGSGALIEAGRRSVRAVMEYLLFLLNQDEAL